MNFTRAELDADSDGEGKLIAVDIGNSSIRLGQFSHNSTNASQLAEIDAECTEFEDLEAWCPPPNSTWIVSSVNRPAQRRLAHWHSTRRTKDTYRLLGCNDVPLSIDVEYPERVGMDRLLAAVAVNSLRRRSQPAIVVDAGSAITVDVVSPSGAFLGGAILPGISMAAAALHRRTDQLPDVERGGPLLAFQSGEPQQRMSTSPPDVIGKSTDEALRSGLVWGTVGALKYLVSRAAEDLEGDPLVVFAGGDASLLAPLVQPGAVTQPNLVLQGIAITYHHLMQSGQGDDHGSAKHTMDSTPTTRSNLKPETNS